MRFWYLLHMRNIILSTCMRSFIVKIEALILVWVCSFAPALCSRAAGAVARLGGCADSY